MGGMQSETRLPCHEGSSQETGRSVPSRIQHIGSKLVVRLNKVRLLASNDAAQLLSPSPGSNGNPEAKMRTGSVAGTGSAQPSSVVQPLLQSHLTAVLGGANHSTVLKFQEQRSSRAAHDRLDDPGPFAVEVARCVSRNEGEVARAIREHLRYHFAG